MDYLNAGPVSGKALCYQAAVALFGGGFAAQEAASLLLEEGAVEAAGDVALVHEGFEALDIDRPFVILAVGRKDFVCGR
jgi:hypothetical protein